MRTIHIPKFEEGDFVSVEVLKRETTPKELVLKRQNLLGVVIPKGTTIKIESCSQKTVQSNHSGTEFSIPGQLINPTLRYLYLETIRNNK